MEVLFGSHSDVVIGRVTGVALPYDPSVRMYTVYTFAVERVVTGDGIVLDETINVGQVGGLWDDVAYQDAGNALLRVGERYLLALHEFPFHGPDVGVEGYFLSQPFAQFAIDEDKLRPKDKVWADLPAVAELTGLTVENTYVRLKDIVRPTPIPDATLLAEISAIPIPAGTVTDSGPGVFGFGSVEGHSGFYGQMRAEDVLSFYASTLANAGWTPETGPDYVSWQHEGSDVMVRTVKASYVKGDLRLMLAGDLTVPPRNWTGLPGWELTLQPIWCHGFDSSSIPAPSTQTAPIPSGVRRLHMNWDTF